MEDLHINTLRILLADLLESKFPLERQLEAARKVGGPGADQVPLSDVLRFRRSVELETDRGCALSVAAYLDSELGSLLRATLIDDSKVTDALLSGRGGLSDFSARIDIAYLLGVISQTAHRDLHLIRKIRNDFAHVPGDITFDSQSIASRCRELRHVAAEARLSPRALFVGVAMVILGIIHIQKLQAVPRARPHDFASDTLEREERAQGMAHRILEELLPESG